MKKFFLKELQAVVEKEEDVRDILEFLRYYEDEENSTEDYVEELLHGAFYGQPKKIWWTVMPHVMSEDGADPEEGERGVAVVLMDDGRVGVFSNLLGNLVEDYSFAGDEYRIFESVEDFKHALEECGYNKSWEQRPNFAPLVERVAIPGGSNEELKVWVMEEAYYLYPYLRDSEKTVAATVAAVGQNLVLFKQVPEDLLKQNPDLEEQILDRALQDMRHGAEVRGGISLMREFDLSYENRTDIDIDDPFDKCVVDMVERLKKRCNQ